MAVYELAYSPVQTVAVAKISPSWTNYGWSAPTRVNNTVVKGDIADFWGTLMAENLPIADATIILMEYNLDTGVNREVARAVTNIEGKVMFENIVLSTEVAPTQGYYYGLEFRETDVYYSLSVYFAVMIEARTPNLTLTMPASVNPGEAVTWSGVMFDPKVTTLPISNREILLEESVDQVTWVTVAGPVMTGADGSYSGAYTPPAPGTFFYRAFFAGGAGSQTYEKVVSGVVKVRVEEAPPPPEVPWNLIFGAAATTFLLYLATKG